jgi:hypothetical protein
VQRAEADRRFVAAAALIGGALAATFSRQGVRFDPDSAAYLRGAELLLDDPTQLASLPSGGLIDLPGTLPPFYAVLLAATGWLTDLPTAARLVGIASAAAVFGGLAVLIGRHGGTRATVATLAAVTAARGMVQLPFSFVLSEGPYLALLVWAMVVAEPLLREPSPHSLGSAGWWRLARAAALLGAAGATRYAGLGAIAATAAVFAISWRHRPVLAARVAATIAGIGIAPLALWAAIATGGGIGARRFAWRPRSLADLDLFGDLLDAYLPGPLTSWLPDPGVSLLATALLAGAAAGSVSWVLATRDRPTAPNDRAVGLLLAVAWSQLIIVVGTRLFLDPYVVVGGRTLLPWLILLVAAAGIRWAPVLDSRSWSSGTIASRLGCGAVVVTLLVASVTFARDLVRPDLGWWNVARVDPAGELAPLVDSLARDERLFTNDQAVVYLLSGELAEQLEIDDPREGLPLGDAMPVEAAVRDLARHGGLLVVVTDGSMPFASPAQLIEHHGLVEVARSGDWVALSCAGACR